MLFLILSNLFEMTLAIVTKLFEMLLEIFSQFTYSTIYLELQKVLRFPKFPNFLNIKNSIKTKVDKKMLGLGN